MFSSAQDVMLIGGIPAVLSANTTGTLLRGVFLGLGGEVDFYAPTLAELEQQGVSVLRGFFRLCRRQGRSPLLLRAAGQQGYVVEDLYACLEEPARNKGIDLYRVLREQTQCFHQDSTDTAGEIVYLAL
ncbi:toxin-antitoxin system protein HicB [Acetobacter vaccinii]|uniref:Toxin-antitoxin system protein HicB n=1 Tax=Acetobacter vaccinii TaxID=2592655 RepID=A0A5C1YR09_9PROT|nr:toxin-antitoxin system protein HicB [Acetobacter vaccinii]QEO17629.1 toxin-antitoxin system protein HicB [Acetobacter vaccinii]